jgi:hypothetical protein
MPGADSLAGLGGIPGGKRAVVLGIGLQTHVLKTCPAHDQLYFDDEEYTDRAFALAVELMRQKSPCVSMFNNDVHELTELLSHTLAGANTACPHCQASMPAGRHALVTKLSTSFP